MLSFVALRRLVSVNNSAWTNRVEHRSLLLLSEAASVPAARGSGAGSRQGIPADARQKREQNTTGANYIVQRIYTLL